MKMLFTRYFAVIIFAALLGEPTIGQAAGQPAFSMPVGKSECFESLRGNLQQDIQGHTFAVSPDGRWISAISNNAGKLALELLYIPSSRHWKLPLTADTELGIVKSVFWQNFISDELHVGPYLVKLDPGMGEIELKANDHPTMRQEINDKLFGRPGFQMPPEIISSHSPADGVRYQAVFQGQVNQALLKTGPGGKLMAVDYGLVLAAADDAKNREQESFKAEMLELFKKNQPNATAEENRLMASRVNGLSALLSKDAAVQDNGRRVGISYLEASPNHSFLAANVDAGGKDSIGVIIPLDRGGLAAFPYAVGTFYSALWSADSSRLYYYGDTVCRLTLDKAAIPAQLPVIPVPEEKLAAPSNYDLNQIQYNAVKSKHFEIISRQLEQPQEILEFRSQRAYLRSGHVIILAGITYTTKEADEKFTAFVNARLLNRPIFVKIDRGEFLQHYIPSSRSGVFADTSKYQWPMEGKEYFGEIPGLIYDGEALINEKYGEN